MVPWKVFLEARLALRLSPHGWTAAFFRWDSSSLPLVVINPFTAQACKVSGLKSAHTHLQTVYFPGPITHLPSLLCVLMPTLTYVMRKRKEKCFRIWNFSLLLWFSSDVMAVKRLRLCVQWCKKGVLDYSLTDQVQNGTVLTGGVSVVLFPQRFNAP